MIELSLDYSVKLGDRVDRSTWLLLMAYIVSLRATCHKGGPKGAVIVRDNRIVSMGYNGAPAGRPHCLGHDCILDETGGCSRSVHAEANAITFAAREGISCKGATLYCTTAPCRKCAQLIVNAGIQKVVYSEEYKNDAGVSDLKLAGVPVQRLELSLSMVWDDTVEALPGSLLMTAGPGNLEGDN